MDILRSLRLITSVVPEKIMRSMVFMDFANLPADPSFRLAALIAAREALKSGAQTARFREEMGAGTLTKGRRVSIGCTTGILFSGTFDYLGQGEGRMEFIIDDCKIRQLDRYIDSQMS